MADVLHTLEGHVATITLSNEGRYNAMSLGMWTALADLLEQLGGNHEVRAVILRGAGEKAFVSGADISEFGEQRSNPASVAAYDAAVARAQGALSSFRCPVIAAISGICYGGGLGLVLACDLRYCAPNAKFRMPAARLGLGYSLPGIQRMVAILGAASASEMFYSARVYDADAAREAGLVNAVREDVFRHAAIVGAEIATNAPLTIRAAKLAFNTVLSGSEETGAAIVDAAVDACFKSADYAEGRAAFAEKRLPKFNGN